MDTVPPLADDDHATGPIRLLFCCNPEFFQHLAVTLASLYETNADNIFDIHVISSRPDAEAEAKLCRSLETSGADRPNISYVSWEDERTWFTSYHIRTEAYARILAPRVLGEDIGRVLYLDCDIVVTGDLQPLWNIDLGDCVAAAAPDPFGRPRRGPLGLPRDAVYFNSGVLLMDLRRWREQGLTERLAAYIRRAGDRLVCHDQDAINAVLHGLIKVLDYRWNVQAAFFTRRRLRGFADRDSIVAATRAPSIIHYTSARKPWMFVMATPRKRLYWRYLRKTEWRSARSSGRAWKAVPERVVNHLLHYVGSEFTWDRVLRSTRVGRVLDRAILALGARATAEVARRGSPAPK